MSNDYKYILASFLLGVITNHLITTYCYSNLYEGVAGEETSTPSNTGIWIIGGLMIFGVLSLIAWGVISNRNVELNTDVEMDSVKDITGP